jgi:hypothetical protein
MINTITSTSLSVPAEVAFTGLFPEVTPSVVICSLAGSALYVVTSGNYGFWERFFLALVSFVGGIYGADITSIIMTAVIHSALGDLIPPKSVEVTPAIGALVASTICVTVLLRIQTGSRR